MRKGPRQGPRQTGWYVYPQSSAIADKLTALFLIAARRRGGAGDHWEPEDRERRNDVRSLVLSLQFLISLPRP